MYCFEAHKCNRFDCPVQSNQIKRCWEYLATLHDKEITTDECPYAPCSKCNYKLGWDIGLIGESMFPENADPSPETLLPRDALTDKCETPADESHDSPNPITKNSTLAEDSDRITYDDEKEQTMETALGKPGMRFCHEVVECRNPNCIVRQQQIIRCFQFFANKTADEKRQMTCTERKCEDCFYKRGWDLGMINDDLFIDILENKKLKISTVDRSKRNTLVEIYLAELSKKPLSRQEEYKLAQKIAGDKEASEIFLMANLKLVMRVAKKFSSGRLGLMDLIQEGNIGLIKAIARFDHTLGYRFSTYAAYWIKYYMQKAVANQGTSIKIPYHLLTVSNKIRRQIQLFEAEFFRAPSLTELAELMQLDPEKVLTVLRVTQTPVSINSVINSDGDEETLEYFIADKKTLTPEESALERLKQESVIVAINKLPDRLQFVVKFFYGFEKEELTLAEIGRRLDISRERARQLLAQALRLLREEELIASLLIENE